MIHKSSRPEQSSTRPAHQGRSRGRGAWAPAALIGLSGVVAGGGCEVDSFMDPSVVGRWEKTPTVVPILSRIDVIERDSGEFVDVTSVTPEDLIPEPTEYRVSAGDVLTIEVLDFIEVGRISEFERFVDPLGFIDLPQVGRVQVTKMTRQQVELVVRQAIIDAQLLDDPLVTVQVPGQRQATFSVFGVVERAGRYPVPSPDYKLLQALTDAGGISPTIDKVYVIRQVRLTDDGGVASRLPVPAPAGTPRPAEPSQPNLVDLIDSLTAPEGQTEPEQTPPSAPEEPGSPEAQTSPSVMRSSAAGTRSSSRSAAVLASAQPEEGSPAGDEPPVIDLPPLDDASAPVPVPTGPEPAIAMPDGARSRWVFLNGEWVNVVETGGVPPTGLPEGVDPMRDGARPAEVTTQRVIEVPVKPLLQGVASQNLVVRPGDVISVPGPSQGFVYVMGPGSSRGGVYQLPFTGDLTLKRLIASSGGFSAIAIPERVDLVRMVGADRQATIRLNLRAIFSDTQPDIFMKPNDLVNIGTNFWATPLAVLRGGLRASYGFGFLLDRNFGNDVFGAPEGSVGGN